MAARSKRAAILFRKWRFARPRAFGRWTGPAPPRGTSRRPPTSRLPRAGVKEAPQQKLRLVVIAHHEHPVQAGQAGGVMGKNIRRGRGHDAAFELRRVYHVARIGMECSRSGYGRHVASGGVEKTVVTGGGQSGET